MAINEKNPARLALFDLDNTLLGGDSDHAWGEFLIERGLVDETRHRSENDRFYRDYQAGELDIHAYVAFTLQAIMPMGKAERDALRAEFIEHSIKPMLLPAALELVESHRQQGDLLLIITATNRFITEPIATLFAIDSLLATELEQDGERYTGTIAGVPCYREGKITRLEQWLQQNQPTADLSASVFYSDSINDLPLLARAGEAVAVDPDDSLRAEAELRGWRILSLRGENEPPP